MTQSLLIDATLGYQQNIFHILNTVLLHFIAVFLHAVRHKTCALGRHSLDKLAKPNHRSLQLIDFWAICGQILNCTLFRALFRLAVLPLSFFLLLYLAPATLQPNHVISQNINSMTTCTEEPSFRLYPILTRPLFGLLLVSHLVGFLKVGCKLG